MIPIRQFLLVSLTLLVAAAHPGKASESARGERYQATATTYQQADATGKRRILQELLSRSDAAASVTSSGAELEHRRDRNRAILDRAAQGRELTDDGLLELLADVDDQERLAIAKLRREFAFSTAQAFHDNRAEFNKWHDAWERIESRYQQNGRPLAWQKRMIDWLALATARQAQVTIARLHPSSGTPRSLPRQRLPRGEADLQQSELDSRIAGYNLAVSRLISELHTKEAWTIDDLGRAAAELADLSTTYHDLNLYWKLLPQNSQARQTPLRSLEMVIPLLARRTGERRRDLEKSSANSPRAAWELRRLDEISRRLAMLADPRS